MGSFDERRRGRGPLCVPLGPLLLGEAVTSLLLPNQGGFFPIRIPPLLFLLSRCVCHEVLLSDEAVEEKVSSRPVFWSLTLQLQPRVLHLPQTTAAQGEQQSQETGTRTAARGRSVAGQLTRCRWQSGKAAVGGDTRRVQND